MAQKQKKKDQAARPQAKSAAGKAMAKKTLTAKSAKPKSHASAHTKKAQPIKSVAKSAVKAVAKAHKSASAKKPVAVSAPKVAPAKIATSAKAAPKVVAAPAKAAPAAIKAAVKPGPSVVVGGNAAAIAAAAARARQAMTPAPAQRAVPASVQKPAGQKISAPLAPPAAAHPVRPKEIAEKTAAARQLLAAQKKPVSQRHGFKANEFIVYPSHGVGKIVGIEEQEIAGMTLELFVISFDKEKLTLRVPTGKLESVGMRKLAEEDVVKKALETLKGRARVKRTMWSRRAQEYVAKINSGDLVSIAEVVRDLYRSEAQPEQSYSERQLYEDALDRMAREIAAVEKLDERGAVQRLTDILSKSAKGRRLAAEEAEIETEVDAEDETVRAA